jgi:cell division initiation protein
MTLTPVEVRHLELRRGFLGYRRSHVHRTIEEIADSFEDVWRERSELTERVHDLEGEVARHVELEALLRSTLVSAERAAQDMKEHARREADVIVQEAGAEGRRLIRDAIAEKEQLLAETRRVRSIMRAALDVLAEGRELRGEDGRDEPAERAEAATPQLTGPPAASPEVDRLAG